MSGLFGHAGILLLRPVLDNFGPFVVLYVTGDGPPGNLISVDQALDVARGRVIVALNGTLTYSNSEPVPFGTTWIKCSASSYASFAPSTDFYAPPGTDFCVECYVYKNSAVASGDDTWLGSFNDASANRWLLGTNNSKPAWYWMGSQIARSPSDLPRDVPVHVAYTREGTVGRLFVQGTIVATIADSNNYSSPERLSIFGGAAGEITARPATCLKKIRFTIGAARYIANFTP